MWLDYQKERFGYESIEEDWGFLLYSIMDKTLAIQEIYVKPEARFGIRGLELLNRASKIGRERGCTFLWTQVWLNDKMAARALRCNLACNFKMIEAHNGRIVLIKEIEKEGS